MRKRCSLCSVKQVNDENLRAEGWRAAVRALAAAADYLVELEGGCAKELK